MRCSIVLAGSGFRAILGGASLLVVLGCGGQDGPPRATVTGTVTVDGVPLHEGSISFIPTGGTLGPVAGGIIKDGAYQIDDSVCVGTNRVEIRGRRKTGRKIAPVPPAPPDQMIEETVDATPAKFNSESTLQETIAPGTNSLDFNLRVES